MKTITIRFPFDRDITITRHDTYGLEDAFAEFNSGSGQECDEYLEAHIRSFSVGDLVKIDGVWNRCESSGWLAMGDLGVMEYMTAIETKLIELRKDNPDLSPWFAINDVVYKIKKESRPERWALPI